MGRKIKVNIPGFGERYCSDNVEYKIISNGFLYLFYKKGNEILHNEYGPASENKYGNYVYLVNGHLHRLEEYSSTLYKEYSIIGKSLGKTKRQFIKNLANILIPTDKNE